MGVKEEAPALCPRLYLHALAPGNLPGALGSSSTPVHRWGAPGPARLGDLVQGQEFIMSEFMGPS